jgi:hypothetical protein
MTSPVLPAISDQSVMDATRVGIFRDPLQAQDLPARVADAPANVGFDTVGQIARLDRAYLKSRPHPRPKTLRELVGRPKERLTAAGVIAPALSLSRTTRARLWWTPSSRCAETASGRSPSDRCGSGDV